MHSHAGPLGPGRQAGGGGKRYLPPPPPPPARRALAAEACLRLQDFARETPAESRIAAPPPPLLGSGGHLGGGAPSPAFLPSPDWAGHPKLEGPPERPRPTWDSAPGRLRRSRGGSLPEPGLRATEAPEGCSRRWRVSGAPPKGRVSSRGGVDLFPPPQQLLLPFCFPSEWKVRRRPPLGICGGGGAARGSLRPAPRLADWGRGESPGSERGFSPLRAVGFLGRPPTRDCAPGVAKKAAPAGVAVGSRAQEKASVGAAIRQRAERDGFLGLPPGERGERSTPAHIPRRCHWVCLFCMLL